MIRRIFVCLSIVGAAVAGPTQLAVPAAANEATAQATQAKPMKLKKFMKKPVASSATRTVKKKNGEYTKPSTKRGAARSAATPVPASPPAPEKAISPEAAQAMASYELARVRVVTPETTGSANLLTDPTSTIVNIDTVEVVNAEEINDIDRKADSPAAVSLDALSRDLAGSGGRDFAAIEPKIEPRAESHAPDNDTWLQRLLTMLGSAFAAVTALARTLLG
jgi:hypothetical protein